MKKTGKSFRRFGKSLKRLQKDLKKGLKKDLYRMKGVKSIRRITRSIKIARPIVKQRRRIARVLGSAAEVFEKRL